MKKIFRSDREHLAGTLLRDGDYRSIRDVLERINRFVPDDKVLAGLDGKGGIFYITCHELHEEVMNLGDGLIDAGLSGTHIAIVADNSCRYVIADIAISNGVGVVVPIDKDAPLELLRTLLTKCDADAVLCGAAYAAAIKTVQSECPLLKTIITIDKEMPGCLFYDNLVAKGSNLKTTSCYRNLDTDPDAPAKILFTSGTTGANKGVVLTNGNLTANINNCLDSIRAEKVNTSMSVLPMHHATEINTHIMARIGAGRLTYINDSLRNLMANMKVFKPQIITVVPMIANAFHKAIWANAEKAGKAEKLKKGIVLSNLLRKFGIDRTHIMFKEIQEQFGGNLNMLVCGGSMLNPVTVKGLNDIGIRVENGYGITECGPLISINGDTLTEHLSVGVPCYTLQVRLDNPDSDGIGELCVKGPSVAKGYYKDDEATRKVFGADGFFNTGDSARIDGKGRIFLMGRKKNTIVLPNGKNVCPEEVENVIESSISYASDIVVYQASHKGGSVLCAGLYIPEEDKRADREAIKADIVHINTLLSSYKAIDYVELPDKEYPKTSTRKIRRTGLPLKCSDNGISIK